MRSKFIAANWKMNTTRAEAAQLASGVASRVAKHERLTVAVCPPFPYLDVVGRTIEGSTVQLGAQNLYPEPSGAYTGEVSGPMLVELGCRYCIVGHSERRHIMGETDAMVHRKIKAALAVGLIPIVCVGERLPDRDAGQTMDVVGSQLSSAIAGLNETEVGDVVFAYEPVWAIGTGRNATPEQAEEVHSHIRKMLSDRYNAILAGKTVIQYGGSVKAANAESLLAQPNVDGALVGGASLHAGEFLAIVATGLRVMNR